MGEQAMQVREHSGHPMLALVAQRREFVEPLCTNGITFDEAMSDFGVAFIEKPELGDSKPSSILKTFCLYVRLGLRLTFKNYVHLVKYGQDLQLQMGYQGYAELARRTGKIGRFKVRAVYDGDEFRVEDGDADEVFHKPDVMADRLKDPTHFYAMAWLTDGSLVFEWMTKAQIDRVKAEYANERSPAWKSPHGRVEMGKKTVFIALAKWLPMSPEMVDAMDNDPDYSRHDARAEAIGAAVDAERGVLPPVDMVANFAPEQPASDESVVISPAPVKRDANGQLYDDLTPEFLT